MRLANKSVPSDETSTPKRTRRQVEADLKGWAIRPMIIHLMAFALAASLMSACAVERHKAIQLKPISPRGEAEPFVYTEGEFKTHGRLPWTNGMRLKDAIDSAGGFTDFARRGVVLRHCDGTGEYYRFGPRRSLKNNPALKPGDTVATARQDL